MVLGAHGGRPLVLPKKKIDGKAKLSHHANAERFHYLPSNLSLLGKLLSR